MAITFPASARNSTLSGTSMVFSAGAIAAADIQTDDGLLIVHAKDSALLFSTPTDSGAEAWTTIHDEGQTLGADGAVSVYIRKVNSSEVSGGSLAITTSWADSQESCASLIVVRGIDWTSPESGTSVMVTDIGTATPDPSNITGITSGDMVIVLATCRQNAGLPGTHPTGYTGLAGDSAIGVGFDRAGNGSGDTQWLCAYKEATATSENPPTWTSVTSRDYKVLTFALTAKVATQTITPTLATELVSTFDPTLTTTVTISPAQLIELLNVFTPTIAQGGVTLTPTLLQQLAVALDPTVTPGAVTISPAQLVELVNVFAPTVTTSITITPNLLAQLIAALTPTVTTGAVTLNPTLAQTLISIFAPTVAPSSVTQTITVDLLVKLILSAEPVIGGGNCTLPAVSTATAPKANAEYDAATLTNVTNGISGTVVSRMTDGVMWHIVDHDSLSPGGYGLYAVDKVNDKLIWRGSFTNAWSDVEDIALVKNGSTWEIHIWDNGADKVYIYTEPATALNQTLVTVTGISATEINLNTNNSGNIIGSGNVEAMAWSESEDAMYWFGPRGTSSDINDSDREVWRVDGWTGQSGSADAATYVGPIVFRPSDLSAAEKLTIPNACGAVDISTDGNVILVAGVATGQKYSHFHVKKNDDTWDARLAVKKQPLLADSFDHGALGMENGALAADMSAAYVGGEGNKGSSWANIYRYDLTYTPSVCGAVVMFPTTAISVGTYPPTYPSTYPTGGTVAFDPTVDLPNIVAPEVTQQIIGAYDPTVAVLAQILSPDLVQELLATFDPTFIQQLLTILAGTVSRFYRLTKGSDRLLYLVPVGRRIRVGVFTSEGYEAVSARFVHSTGDERTIMTSMAAIWAANQSATAAVLQSAIHTELTSQGYRGPGGVALA